MGGNILATGLRQAIPVPLNDDAVARITKQIGKHPTHVFSFRGKPATQFSTKAGHIALQKAGIANSDGMTCSTSLFALQELEGWKSQKMVRRYRIAWSSKRQRISRYVIHNPEQDDYLGEKEETCPWKKYSSNRPNSP